MTEASHQMTSNPLPDVGPHKPGTVGTAQGSVRVSPRCAQDPGMWLSPWSLMALAFFQHIACVLTAARTLQGQVQHPSEICGLHRQAI